jgi:predicted amidohydrolase
MNAVRLALIQLAYGDDEPVADRVARAGDLVRGQADADLVVLPELWAPTGFGYRDWEERAEPVDGPTATAMSALAREVGVTLHAGSIVERLPQPGPDGQTLANTSLVFGPDGALLATYRKIHRFGFGSGEPRLMEAGGEVVVTEVAGVPPGLSTCYDLRFPELYRAQLDAGAELFLVPAAWPAPRVAAWSLLGRARAVEDQCFVVACNTAGTHAGIEMGGRSQVVAPTGEVLAEAGTGEEVLRAEIDPGQVASFREAFPVLADRRLGVARVGGPWTTQPADEGSRATRTTVERSGTAGPEREVPDLSTGSSPQPSAVRSATDERLVRRRAALAAALDSIPAESRTDVRHVARRLVTPGFADVPIDGDDALSADRRARTRQMAEVLTAFPMLLGTGEECAAEELTRPRDALVHPTTGEVVGLLDWVLRGGPAATAIAALPRS